MNQKGGAVPSQHWLKVTRRNQNDVIVEIIDSTKKNELCAPTPSSSASGGGANNETFYASFDEFVNDDDVDKTNKILLLKLAGNDGKFDNDFDLETMTQITTDHIGWDNPVGC